MNASATQAFASHMVRRIRKIRDPAAIVSFVFVNPVIWSFY